MINSQITDDIAQCFNNTVQKKSSYESVNIELVNCATEVLAKCIPNEKIKEDVISKVGDCYRSQLEAQTAGDDHNNLLNCCINLIPDICNKEEKNYDSTNLWIVIGIPCIVLFVILLYIFGSIYLSRKKPQPSGIPMEDIRQNTRDFEETSETSSFSPFIISRAKENDNTSSHHNPGRILPDIPEDSESHDSLNGAICPQNSSEGENTYLTITNFESHKYYALESQPGNRRVVYDQIPEKDDSSAIYDEPWDRKRNNCNNKPASKLTNPESSSEHGTESSLKVNVGQRCLNGKTKILVNL